MTEKNSSLEYSRSWSVSRWPKFTIFLFAILLLNPCSLVIVTGILGDIHDSFILNRFSQPFFDYPLPDETIEIRRETQMRYDGSHGCSFHAVKVIQSTMNLEQIKEYYATVGFSTPHGEPFWGDEEGLMHPRVEEVEENIYRLVLWGGGSYVGYEDDTFHMGCW